MSQPDLFIKPKVPNEGTQNWYVLEWMKKWGAITPMDAFKHIGCMRLAARIRDLEDMGYVVRSDWVKFTTRFGKVGQYKRYWIA